MAEEHDVDPQETREWLDSLHSVLEKEGIERAHQLIERLVDEMRRSGAHLPYTATTAYLNTIRKSDEEQMRGEPGLEHRIRSINRWNALALTTMARAFQRLMERMRCSRPGSPAICSSSLLRMVLR